VQSNVELRGQCLLELVGKLNFSRCNDAEEFLSGTGGFLAGRGIGTERGVGSSKVLGVKSAEGLKMFFS